MKKQTNMTKKQLKKFEDGMCIIHCSMPGCPSKHPASISGRNAFKILIRASQRFICYKHEDGMRTGDLTNLLRTITKELNS